MPDQRIHVLPSKRAALEHTGGYINKLIREAQTDILLLLSGGSALDVVEFLDATLFDDRVTIGFIDERYSQDNEHHNFHAFTQTQFYATVKGNGTHIIDTSRLSQESTVEEAAEVYEDTLHNWTSGRQGIVIALLGVGSDGHTAGIMPYPEDAQLFTTLFSDDTWVRGYNVGNKNDIPLRITTTLTFLDKADHVVGFMSGASKDQALCRMCAIGPVHDVPGRFVYNTAEALFIDEPLYNNSIGVCPELIEHACIHEKDL